MAKGGGGSGTTTVKETNIPDQFQPLVNDLGTQISGQMDRPYNAYGDQRLYEENPDTLAAYDSARNLAPRYVGDFERISGNQGTLANEAARQGFSYYQASPENIGFEAAGDVSTGEFTGSNIEKYMNPFTDRVIDRAVGDIEQRHDRAQLDRDSVETGMSAFGSHGRGAVQNALAREATEKLKSDTEATLLQDAYDKSQSYFTADATRGLEAQRYNQVRDLEEQGRTIEAQQLRERLMQDEAASRQAAESMKQSGLGLASDISNRQGVTLGMAEDSGYRGADALASIGKDQEMYDQRALDIAYEDFLTQDGYDKDHIDWLSGVIRGIPGMTDTRTRMYENNSSTGDVIGGVTALAGAAGGLYDRYNS